MRVCLYVFCTVFVNFSEVLGSVNVFNCDFFFFVKFLSFEEKIFEIKVNVYR